jgi:hypothetical protein
MMMTMYKKILPLVNRFIYLRQGYFSRFYEGKILEVTPDTLTLQAYDEQGRMDSQWVIALPTITEFMTGDRDLDELNMKVSMAKTIEQAELTELEQLSLMGLELTVPYPESSCPTTSGLVTTLLSPTAGCTEVATGELNLNKKKCVASAPPVVEGATTPKTASLYSNISETLRSTATYLEETLGFASPHSASSTTLTPIEDDSKPL